MFGSISASEVDVFEEYWTVWPTLRSQLFKGGGVYLECIDGNLKPTINANADVRKFRARFAKTIVPLYSWLVNELATNPLSVDIARIEQTISNKLSQMLEDFSLIDPYEAYQVLDDIWQKSFLLDLEMLQTEGMEAATKVDPNMATKKKSNKDDEVQCGWIGRILSFELIERELLSDESERIWKIEDDLSSCMARIEQTAKELTEDERELLSDALDGEKISWKITNVRKVLEEALIDNLKIPDGTIRVASYIIQQRKNSSPPDPIYFLRTIMVLTVLMDAR